MYSAVTCIAAFACISSIVTVHAAIITKRQTPEQASQLAAQVAQLSSMDAPKLAADKAYMASMYAIISSQAAAMGLPYPYTVPGDLTPHPSDVAGSDEDDCPPDDESNEDESKAYGGTEDGLAVPSSTPSAQTTPLALTTYTGTGTGLSVSYSAAETTSSSGLDQLQHKAVNDGARDQLSASSSDPAFGAKSVQGQGSTSTPIAGMQQGRVEPTPSSVSSSSNGGASSSGSSSSSGGGGSGAGSVAGSIAGSDPCKAYVPGGHCPEVKFTFYNPGGAAGICGDPLTDDSPTFAFSHGIMNTVQVGTNTNDNPLCGKQIVITRSDGSTVTATLRDACDACTADNHIDLPENFWKNVTGEDTGKGWSSEYSYTWI